MDEEREILLAAKRGEIEAFEAILAFYEKPIFNYIYRIVQQRQDAEDLTQETFLKVYKHLRKVNPEGNFRSWVYTIATNTTYDFLRKKRRQGDLIFIGEQEEIFETSDNSLTYSNMEELISDVDLNRALGALRPVYKTVLLLFYQQDFSYQQIADMLSVPVNTVKTYIYRAKAALKRELYARK